MKNFKSMTKAELIALVQALTTASEKQTPTRKKSAKADYTPAEAVVDGKTVGFDRRVNKLVWKDANAKATALGGVYNKSTDGKATWTFKSKSDAKKFAKQIHSTLTEDELKAVTARTTRTDAEKSAYKADFDARWAEAVKSRPEGLTKDEKKAWNRKKAQEIRQSMK